jgi:hypothetical protein
MNLSTTISLPQNVQNQVSSAGPQFSVDPLVLSAIAQVMSGGQQTASDGGLLVNSLGGVGVMGISEDTANKLGYDATNENENILAGAAYMSQLLGLFTGNYPMAVAAYFSGPALVSQYSGVPPLASVQQFVYNVTTLARRAGSGYMTTKSTLENQAAFDPTPGAETQQLVTPVGQSIDPKQTTQAQSLVTNLQIDTGLDETPWFTDAASGRLVTGNPRIRQTVQPVQFMIYLSRTQNIFLHNPNDQTPIVLQLNTSIRTFELQSKHIYNRTPSRTGMHITFWGMQADLINGTGSTGVFMNQFGITDFMSIANVTDDVKNLVTSGFSRSFKPTTVTNVQGSTGEVFTNTFSGGDQQFNTIVNAQAPQDPSAAFRVAAQDAFVEFLKLFQMNGNVWFYSKNYKGSYTGQQQQDANSWSESTGATSFEQVARNNDVMTRGFVAMRYKNNVYLGYFKSFNWTQDAEKPFAWEFNFTFQVERTYSALYWPNFGVSQFGQALQQTAGVVSPSTSTINEVIE